MYKRKRSSIIRDIHKCYSNGDSFGALRFSKHSPYAGDMVLMMLAVRECESLGAGGLTFLSALMAANDIEMKIGFFGYDVFLPIYGKSFSAQLIMKLYKRGLIEAAPFPDTFSHILRRKRVYRLSDKGRKCLRLFRDTFNQYQREVKRAKIKAIEGI